MTVFTYGLNCECATDFTAVYFKTTPFVQKPYYLEASRLYDYAGSVSILIHSHLESSFELIDLCT